MDQPARAYEVSFEVAAPLAMFTRPDTGGTPTSYPVPTWSALKSIFESVAFLRDGSAWICPTKVVVCRRTGEPGGRVRFQRYATNYGGPLRKADLLRKGLTSGGSSMQLFATVLSDVVYRLHGRVVSGSTARAFNARHYLQALFNRRLRQGRCFRTPCLGWSEFTCSYWGPLRDGRIEQDDGLSLEIPSMLLSIWSRPWDGDYAPAFQQNVQVIDGVLEYDIPSTWKAAQEPEANFDAQ